MVAAPMAAESQFRVNLDEKLKEAVDAVLERQGTSQRIGVTRLFKWFVDLPPEMHAMILGQVHGEGKQVLAKAVLERFIAKPQSKSTGRTAREGVMNGS